MSHRSAGADCETGRRLRELRRARGMSQGDVGRKLAPPRSYAAVSDIELGKTAITVPLAKQFADLYDVPISEIVSAGPPERYFAGLDSGTLLERRELPPVQLANGETMTVTVEIRIG